MPIQTPKINLQPQTSFRQVRLTSSEGDRALANFTANVGESLGQMNKAIEGRIHENLKLQGERAGITADNADQLRQDSGARAQAYNEGFMSSYLAKLDMDTSAKFQELSSKYANQPAGDDGLEGAMDQYIQTVVGQTPEGAQPEVEIALRRKAVVVQSKANTAFQERQRNDHKSTLYASLEHNTQNLERIGVPQSDEDIVEFQTYFAQANESINSLERANLLLPGEAAKERLKLKERLEVNTAKQMLMQDENPILLASQIATKSTGDEYLDNMRPDTVTKLVTFAQQLDTAQQTVENRKRKRDQDIRDVAFVDVSRSVFENPADLKNPEKIEGLLDVAQTQEELNQVMKLKKFMTESGQEKYQNSNPSTLQQVTSKVRTLDMTQEELDSLHGQGLSTSDYLSL
ncbi:MAG: hypothetical protein CMF62_06375 [Magnetococcales bacterium]|nr:hypothetical protein [Magnetococcales bacterium]